MEGGDLWRGGDEGVSCGLWGRPSANGWGCGAGKLLRASESPAPAPLSSALELLRPRRLRRWAGEEMGRPAVHRAAAKPAGWWPADPKAHEFPKTAPPQLYYVCPDPGKGKGGRQRGEGGYLSPLKMEQNGRKSKENGC